MKAIEASFQNQRCSLSLKRNVFHDINILQSYCVLLKKSKRPREKAKSCLNQKVKWLVRIEKLCQLVGSSKNRKRLELHVLKQGTQFFFGINVSSFKHLNINSVQIVNLAPMRSENFSLKNKKISYYQYMCSERQNSARPIFQFRD